MATAPIRLDTCHGGTWCKQPLGVGQVDHLLPRTARLGDLLVRWLRAHATPCSGS